MATIYLNDVALEQLKIMAQTETIDDEINTGKDVVVDDYAGGNVDDAYWKGHSDGQAILARDLLKGIREW